MRPLTIFAALTIVTVLPHTRRPEFVFIYRVNYVDVAAGRIMADQSLILGLDSIVFVPRGEEHPPSFMRVIDGRGKYLIPGLYDMHVHLLTGRMSPDRAMTLAVANGVTGMRDMGGYVDSMLILRKRISADSTLPRVWFAGPLLDGGKHRWSHPFAWHISDAASAEAALDSLRALDVDFVKVYGGIPAPAYFALARGARAAQMTFGGHVPSSVATSTAARAGQITFEHATMDLFAECVPNGSAMVQKTLGAWAAQGYAGRFAELKKFRAARNAATCRSMMSVMADNRAYVVPTMVNELKDSSTLASSYLAYLPRDLQQACTATIEAIELAPASSRRSVYRSFQQDVKALHDSGVRLMVGTDTPNPCIVPGFSVHAELVELVRAGLTPFEALRAATTTPRAVLQVKNNDVVLLDANPIDDISQTSNIAGLFMRGRWFTRDELARRLASLNN